MIVRGDNANSLRCPLLRGRPCLGPRCGVWRTVRPVERKFVQARNPKAVSEHDACAREQRPGKRWTFHPYEHEDDMPAGFEEPLQEALARSPGFCGIAGKPARGVR
jgi:hypothetical protein